MEEQYRKEIAWWFAELGSESEVDNYLALFPYNRLNHCTMEHLCE